MNSLGFYTVKVKICTLVNGTDSESMKCVNMVDQLSKCAVGKFIKFKKKVNGANGK